MRPLPLILLLVLGLASCDVERFGVDRSAEVLRKAAPAFHAEPDIAFAREAAAANVKLIEGLVRVSPRNRSLLAQVAEGLCGYAYLFVEDDLEALPPADEGRAPHAARAGLFYQRCREYAVRHLEVKHPGFGETVTGALAPLEAALRRTGPDDVPGLFWLGFSLAANANVSREDVAAIADLPRIEAIMQRVVELDERFYHAGARVCLGALFGSRTRLIGGDPDRGRREIERAITLTGGSFLMHKVILARVYAVAMGNRELFERVLREVVATPGTVMPSERLANEIARRRAARYLALAEELF
ncbi:MAG: hypothetical protein HY906_15005 [Deltaproteobacteria bacterium]|nr:hypothetical protein [Deltaproteobacteria bacterium]